MILDQVFWYGCHFYRLVVPFIIVLQLVLLFRLFYGVGFEIFEELSYAELEVFEGGD
jgi:hypothetical protein